MLMVFEKWSKCMDGKYWNFKSCDGQGLCVWKLRGGMKGVELVNVKSSLNNDGKFWISVKNL